MTKYSLPHRQFKNGIEGSHGNKDCLLPKRQYRKKHMKRKGDNHERKQKSISARY